MGKRFNSTPKGTAQFLFIRFLKKVEIYRGYSNSHKIINHQIISICFFPLHFFRDKTSEQTKNMKPHKLKKNRILLENYRLLVRYNIISLLRKVYWLMVDHFSWWPIGLLKPQKRKIPTSKKRIAYYLWHYPILSEMFIQREVVALKKSSLSVEVVADALDDLEIFRLLLLKKPSFISELISLRRLSQIP